MTDTAPAREPSGAEKMFGDFAPGLVRFTDDVLFGEVWKRPQLSPRERSLITVAALTAGRTPGSSPSTCGSRRITARPNRS
jgi:4-carboxymuconolactone decarboxylase